MPTMIVLVNLKEDVTPEEYERWTNHFEKQGFAKWLASLRDFMELRKVAV